MTRNCFFFSEFSSAVSQAPPTQTHRHSAPRAFTHLKMLFAFASALLIVTHAQTILYEVEYPTYLTSTGLTSCQTACTVNGIRVSADDRIFVSVPRWTADGYQNVSATLAELKPHPDHPKQKVLVPYPSEAANDFSNTTNLVSVLGMEIDPCGKLWVLDQGRLPGGQAENAKLVQYDLETNKETTRIEFGSGVVDLAHSFLNDLVIDIPGNKIYITDSGIRPGDSTTQGALLIVDLDTLKTKRILFNTEFTNAVDTYRFSVNSVEPVLTDSPMMTGADGIALDATASTLHWCPLTGDIQVLHFSFFSCFCFKVHTSDIHPPRLEPHRRSNHPPNRCAHAEKLEFRRACHRLEEPNVFYFVD
jgi:hypothetical protein